MIELKRFRFHFIFLTIWFQFHLLLLLAAARDPAPSPSSSAEEAAANNRGEIDLPFPAKAVALFCALIFISIFSFYLNHWAASTIARGELTAAEAAGDGGGDCRRNPGGIGKEILDTFPILVYSTIKDLRIGVESLECAVCLSEFKDYETLRLIPKCDHVFHPECIDAWLAAHVTCPLCRTNLNSDSGEVAVGVPNPSPSESTELGEQNQENSGSRRGEQAIMSESQENSVNSVSAAPNNNNESRSTTPTNNSCETDIHGGSNENLIITTMDDDDEYSSNNNRSSVPKQQSRNRRSRWRFFGKLPRSNSTGHSLVEVKPNTGSVKNNNMERHTLRLPEDVRRYILLNHAAIGRSASCHVATAPTMMLKGMQGWSDSDGSSRGKRNYVDRNQDRWVLSATPPFVRRKD